jgi:hypothetical protein
MKKVYLIVCAVLIIGTVAVIGCTSGGDGGTVTTAADPTDACMVCHSDSTDTGEQLRLSIWLPATGKGPEHCIRIILRILSGTCTFFTGATPRTRMRQHTAARVRNVTLTRALLNTRKQGRTLPLPIKHLHRPVVLHAIHLTRMVVSPSGQLRLLHWLTAPILMAVKGICVRPATLQELMLPME